MKAISWLDRAIFSNCFICALWQKDLQLGSAWPKHENLESEKLLNFHHAKIWVSNNMS
jgi:hypothetical protein